MDFLLGLPRAVLVVLGLVAGLLLILALNPPVTVCDTQLEELKNRHTPFMVKDKELKLVETTGFQRAVSKCRTINSAGGCLELFEGIKKVVKDLEVSSTECFPELTKSSAFNKPLWETADLIVTLAWGDKPPKDQFERLGWMGEYHLSLYCRIKKVLSRAHGESRWESFREEKMVLLPGAEQAGRGVAWKMSLLSTNCDKVR